jgi:hypothetical protein
VLVTTGTWDRERGGGAEEGAEKENGQTRDRGREGRMGPLL